MNKLKPSDLLTLEQYYQERPSWRRKIMVHKNKRRIMIGAHCMLYFEDRLTMWYQIQEMLLAEKIISPQGIAEELATYNPLIPDGNNWKGTFMIAFDDPTVRREKLQQLVGIEMGLWVKINDHPRLYAIADEDLERTTPDHTSAVHFIRFQLSPTLLQSLQQGATISMGIEHPHYTYTVDPIASTLRDALLKDLSLGTCTK